MAAGDGWQRVAALGDIVPGQPLGAKLGEEEIVLVGHEGQVHVLGGVCPHAYALMCDGFLNGREIECPLHAAIFDVVTGKCLDGPEGTGDLPLYEVKVESDAILVRPRSG